jgi:hypothetical protein
MSFNSGSGQQVRLEVFGSRGSEDESGILALAPLTTEDVRARESVAAYPVERRSKSLAHPTAVRWRKQPRVSEALTAKTVGLQLSYPTRNWTRAVNRRASR